MASLQEAVKALNEDKVVLADFGTRRVKINTLAQTADGSWVAGWSHRDYPQAQIDTIEDSTEFIIRDEYARYR